MKKIIFTILFVSGMSLLYIACKKDAVDAHSALNQNDASFISVAKKYFNDNILNSSNIPGLRVDGNQTMTALYGLLKNVMWGQANTLTFLGRLGVIVPITFNQPLFAKSNIFGASQKLNINTLYRLLIYKDSLDNFQSEFLSVIPDSTFLNTPNSKFSGIVSASDWSGNFLRGYRFQNGNTYILSSLVPTDTSSVKTDQLLQVETVCTTIDYYSCAGDECSYQFTADLGCTSEIIGGGPGGSTNYSIGYQNAATGSNIAPNTTVVSSLNYIVNNLTNPCFKAIVASMISGNLKGEMTNILAYSFGTSDQVNVTFSEKSYNGDPDAAHNTASGGPVDWNFQIFLNDFALQTASKEYVAESAFHEILHAFLQQNPTYNTALKQHEAMLNSYVGVETSALQQLFPNLSTTDAHCLIIGGMEQVNILDPPAFNAALSTYGLTADQVQATNNSYKAGNSGSPCQAVI